MEQEIFKFIKRASDNNRVLNRTDVREIFEYLKDSEDLALVCDSIDFESLDGSTLARFLYNLNMIIMDLDKIIVNSVNDSVYGINLSIVQSLLHEIEHVKQLKMFRFEKSFDNSHNDIEKILIDSSYNYLSNLNLDKNLAQIKDFEDKYLKDDTFNYFRLLYGVHVDEDYLKEKIRKINK